MKKEAVQFLVEKIGEGKVKPRELKVSALEAIIRHLAEDGRVNLSVSDKVLAEQIKEWRRSKGGRKQQVANTLAGLVGDRIRGTQMNLG